MNTTTLNPKGDEPAFYRNFEPGSGAGDAPSGGHWEQVLFCSDGRCVTGRGSSKSQAESEADSKRKAREEFLASDAATQLRAIIERTKGDYDLLSGDMSDAVRLIAKILLA